MSSTDHTSLRDRLDGSRGPLLLDGATGTELERAGIPTGLPLWSTHALIEAPEHVQAIHRAYVEAGAEIITANTFRTQRRTLARAGLGDRDAALTHRALALARLAIPDASERPCWVAGSLPPLEDCYRPDLVPDTKSLAREHGRQTDLLGEGGADLILVETMNSIREAEAACEAAARTGLPFVVGFVSWDAGRLLSGESLAQAATRVLEHGAAAVGVNCVPMASLETSRQVLAPLGTPLLVSPNLGEPDEATGFARATESDAAEVARALDPWLDLPVRVIGGCCGTTPDHIAALACRLARGPTPA